MSTEYTERDILRKYVESRPLTETEQRDMLASLAALDASDALTALDASDAVPANDSADGEE